MRQSGVDDPALEMLPVHKTLTVTKAGGRTNPSGRRDLEVEPLILGTGGPGFRPGVLIPRLDLGKSFLCGELFAQPPLDPYPGQH